MKRLHNSAPNALKHSVTNLKINNINLRECYAQHSGLG